MADDEEPIERRLRERAWQQRPRFSGLLALLLLFGAGLAFAFGPWGLLIAFAVIVFGAVVAIFVILGRDG